MQVAVEDQVMMEYVLDAISKGLMSIQLYVSMYVERMFDPVKASRGVDCTLNTVFYPPLCCVG